MTGNTARYRGIDRDGYGDWRSDTYNHPVCPLGCFPCGRTYYRTNEHFHGCCGGSSCGGEMLWRETQRWLQKREKEQKEQLSKWLLAEQLYHVDCEHWLAAEQDWHDACEVWLAAEQRFKADLRPRRAGNRVRVLAEQKTPVTKATQEAMAKLGQHG